MRRPAEDETTLQRITPAAMQGRGVKGELCYCSLDFDKLLLFYHTTCLCLCALVKVIRTRFIYTHTHTHAFSVSVCLLCSVLFNLSYAVYSAVRTLTAQQHVVVEKIYILLSPSHFARTVIKAPALELSAAAVRCIGAHLSKSHSILMHTILVRLSLSGT